MMKKAERLKYKFGISFDPSAFLFFFIPFFLKTFLPIIHISILEKIRKIFTRKSNIDMLQPVPVL